jgi:hypothetical protein
MASRKTAETTSVPLRDVDSGLYTAEALKTQRKPHEEKLTSKKYRNNGCVFT